MKSKVSNNYENSKKINSKLLKTIKMLLFRANNN